LADDGSVYVRIDYHFGHYVKVVMDEIFQEQNFRNDIVINRVKRRLRGTKQLNVGKESIFLYSKKSDFYFTPAEVTRKCDYCGNEKAPIWDDLTSPGLRNPPQRVIFDKVYLPRRGRHFTYTQDKLDEMAQSDRLRLNPEIPYIDLDGTRIEARPEYLQTETVVVDDNWTDLKGYAYGTGYPTENSEQLLERVISIGSKHGDIVLDAFAGSGTTCAVAEKLGRRWIGIDCGKLAIYTTQKRMLSLKAGIGQKGKPLTPKPFTLYNAGLYDFSTLRQLPWKDWRFFALQLFGCKDEPHKIGGLELDGKRQGASVLVFNHLAQPGRRIDEETIQSIHATLGDKVGSRFFIVAPRGVFDFQQDYIDLEGVRYYALRIPYSFINELHHREFTALKQPADETDVNAIIDAVGFDFIRPPQVTWAIENAADATATHTCLQIQDFESRAYIRGQDTRGGMETLSLLLIDFAYDGELFVADLVLFANALKAADWRVRLPLAQVGEQNMLVFIDIYGNEARELVRGEQFCLGSAPQTNAEGA
jgi:site-specific DNA-methyltransferase (adenine-specific)/adenine-specific DNA-methyltransferase